MPPATHRAPPHPHATTPRLSPRTVDGNALTLDQQRAKPDLVVETAAELWGS